MISFKVFNHWSGAVQFTAKIKCGGDELESVKLGLAARWAHETGARLDGARLDGARLDRASLDGARLDGARLDGARLDRASLVGASLVGASLVGASLVGASLVGASLDGARLDRASLVGASLVGASLDGASLVGASLVGASLVGASLVGASLDGARLDGKDVLTLCGRVTRSDGYEFQMWLFKDGSHVIRAGCQTHDLTGYRAHVAADYPSRYGDPTVETLAILDFLEARLEAVRGAQPTLAAAADQIGERV